MEKTKEIIETLEMFKGWMQITSKQISAIDEIVKVMGKELIELRKIVDGITRKS